MSRVLSGALNPPTRLIDAALEGPGGADLLVYYRARHEGDPAAIRREVLAEIHRIKGQLEFVFERLERADEAERAEMARVLPPAGQGRQRRA